MQCSSLCDNLELTNDIVNLKEVEAIVVVDDEVETVLEEVETVLEEEGVGGSCLTKGTSTTTIGVEEDVTILLVSVDPFLFNVATRRRRTTRHLMFAATHFRAWNKIHCAGGRIG